MAENSPAEAAPAQEPVPIYQIDLSLPPAERYSHLATDLGPKMKVVTPVFDEILAIAIPWAWLRRLVEWVSTFVLRRVYSPEETQELRGIAKASGVDMYFLVALNVLLDSLMGCTSGGILTEPEKRRGVQHNQLDESDSTPRMMHFRTLDWGMDEIRNIIVILEFVKSKSDTPEKVLARTITYAGFVGVLTGVNSDSRTTVIEKDLSDGKVRTASDFIVHTNHDIKVKDTTDPTPAPKEKSSVLGMDTFLEESEERHECFQKKWNSLVKRQEKKRREGGEGKEGDRANTVVITKRAAIESNRVESKSEKASRKKRKAHTHTSIHRGKGRQYGSFLSFCKGL
ncbi:Acid ceramidase [Hyphodiscus hymeniophilus]|uniref:ceramidase n=1 Tax=Hyphodiscus hymeniophilus TaxID=353542 RepID=A0A9P6VF97_9HELO|nr:Acid ceramidase [Hyphodiscus hymeniophilus]